MSLLSKLRPLIKTLGATEKLAVQRQMSDHRVFPLEPTRWHWKKFKDLANFYIWLGVIPCGLFISYQNLFVGPGTLTEIPEGCTPQYWEYFRNPVTRFLAKNFYNNPQQDYEKYCTYIFAEQERMQLRKLNDKVRLLIKERNDYQAYYYRPVAAKYFRIHRENYDAIRDLEDPIPRD